MTSTDIQNILFIDIETVPIEKQFEDLDPEFQKLWSDKHHFFRDTTELTPDQSFLIKGGIYAEFGKIVCISVGYLYEDKRKRDFRIKSFCADNEADILKAFVAMVKKSFNTKKNNFCGHNIKEFDIPYLCRRMLVNNMEIPKILDVSGTKPWETQFIDTLQLWKFGDYKNYTSLKLLAHLFQIQTPKDDMEGKDVASVYWQQNDLNRISIYCQKDVLTTAQLFFKFNRIPLLLENEVTFLK
ncbi:MAG: ribonuclease H-like domain-containing protein [Bacteroidota bacterium]